MTKLKKIAASITAASLFFGISIGIVTAAPATISDKPSGLVAGTDVSTQEAVPTVAEVQEAPAPAEPVKTNAPAPKKPVKVATAPTPIKSRSVAPTASVSTNKAAAIIATAKKYIGVKYQWGGTTPSGFDCSGLVQYAFAKNGISLPRTSRDQFQVGTAVSYSSLKPGDLVFFSLDGDKVVDHDGIYIGNGQFINSSTSKGVTIYSMNSYWQSHYVGAKRVIK